MNINLTILVQLVNFFIAYSVLTKFFLKPWLEVFDKDRRDRARLKHMLSEQQELLLEKKRHKLIQWQRFQAYFNQQRPDPVTHTVVITPDNKGVAPVGALSKEQKTHVVHDVVTALKKKVLV